jgi:choline/glycine/proline betaine transport protein
MLFSAEWGLMFCFQSLFIIFLVRQWPKEELLKQLRKLKFTLTLGFHAWAVYALVGLSLAYFTYSRGLHLLLGLFFILLEIKFTVELRCDRYFAVLATVFGLATLGWEFNKLQQG